MRILEFLPGNDTLLIPALNIKKDPCSNVDPVVKQLCQDSPADCPDVSLRHCEDKNLEAGGNCFIQARDSQIMTFLALFSGQLKISVCGILNQSHLDWDEKASEMCFGAQATECWTFATTKENKTPCMVPMVEDTEDCVEGEICGSISDQFQQTFIDEGYVISIGAAMVCEVLGESFMRGVIEETIGWGVSIINES